MTPERLERFRQDVARVRANPQNWEMRVSLDEAEGLLAEVDRLRAALLPFANRYDQLKHEIGETHSYFTRDVLHAARKAFAPDKEEAL